MPVTARSTPNIALIKYWGNRNDELRLCAADSCSVTLSSPHVDVTVDRAPSISVESFEPDGRERFMSPKHLARFAKVLDLTKQYLDKLGRTKDLPESVSIVVRSQIPPSIGLASSAAVFSALAKAIAGLIGRLTDEEISVIARLGSGSAARSIFGGYGAIRAGVGDEIDSAVGWQIAPEKHWRLHDIVIVPSHKEKSIGSTEGHALAPTSPHFADRIDAIMQHRQQECIDAILKKDFEKLQHVAEEDCMDMHRVMETSTPSLKYLSDATHRIIGEITTLRKAQHLPVLYTMDAGPTVHLFCTDDARAAVAAYAHAQAGCTVFETVVGAGARIL